MLSFCSRKADFTFVMRHVHSVEREAQNQMVISNSAAYPEFTGCWFVVHIVAQWSRFFFSQIDHRWPLSSVSQ